MVSDQPPQVFVDRKVIRRVKRGDDRAEEHAHCKQVERRPIAWWNVHIRSKPDHRSRPATGVNRDFRDAGDPLAGQPIREYFASV